MPTSPPLQEDDSGTSVAVQGHQHCCVGTCAYVLLPYAHVDMYMFHSNFSSTEDGQRKTGMEIDK